MNKKVRNWLWIMKKKKKKKKKKKNAKQQQQKNKKQNKQNILHLVGFEPATACIKGKWSIHI